MRATSCATRSWGASSPPTTASRANARRAQPLPSNGSLALIYVDNRTRGTGLDVRGAVRVLERLLTHIGEDGSSVSLTFVRDAPMRALNRAHRAKDAPTDVLSFPLYAPETFDRAGPTRARERAVGDGAERMLGDIVVSVDTARRQAADYDAPLQREIERLLIHAVLHLAGHDHLEDGERTVMEAEERRLANAIGMPWPYLETNRE